MPKFPRNRAGPLNLLLHQPWMYVFALSGRAGHVFVYGILTRRAPSASFRTPEVINIITSEGVPLLTPIKVQKGCPLSLDDLFHPRTIFILGILLKLKKGVKTYEKP